MPSIIDLVSPSIVIGAFVLAGIVCLVKLLIHVWLSKGGYPDVEE